MNLKFFYCLLFLLLFPFFIFSEESITISTYYPSPVGVYTELRSQRMAIGDNYFNAASYPWDTNGILLAGEVSQDADLVVEGNVGIGTANPFVQLHVHSSAAGIPGTINISGIDSATYSQLLLHDDSADMNNNWFIAHKNMQGAAMQDDLQIGKWITSTPAVTRIDVAVDSETGNVGIGTGDPQARLEVLGGAIKATDGLIIETRTTDPANPAAGQIWLRTDINP